MLRAKLLAVSTAAGLGLAFFAPQAQAILDNNNITVIESCSGNTSSFDDDHANHQGGDGDRANVDNSNSSGSRNCSFVGGYEGLNGLPGLPGGLPVDPTTLIPGGLPGELPPLPVNPEDILADPAGFLGGLPGMLPPLPVNPDDVLANVLDVVGSALPTADVELHVLGIDVLIHGGLVVPTLP